MNVSVLYLFGLIALGWTARKYRVAGERVERAFNWYLFYFAVPCLTVVKIADTSFAGLGLRFVALNLLPVLAAMMFVYAGWRTGLFPLPFARLLMIASGLGNTVYLGFPVVSMNLGPGSIGYAAVVSSLQNVFVFTFGFFFLGLMRGGDAPAAGAGSLVVRNAILWSSLAGLGLSYSGYELPGLLHGIMANVGATTLPLSLFTIGLGLYGRPLGRDLGKVWWIAGLKMICVPAVYMGLALLAGFGGTASKTTFLQMAMPPAVLNYVIAREFGFDADLVSQSIVLCTLLLFPMLFILGPAMKLLP